MKDRQKEREKREGEKGRKEGNITASIFNLIRFQEDSHSHTSQVSLVFPCVCVCVLLQRDDVRRMPCLW